LKKKKEIKRELKFSFEIGSKNNSKIAGINELFNKEVL